MLLYSVILPTKEGNEISLYYRVKGAASIQGGALLLQPGTSAQFDTYFNGFFYSKYLRYTDVHELIVKVSTSGSISADLVCAAKDKTEIVLEHKENLDVDDAFQAVELNSLPEGGMLYCRFHAKSQGLIQSIRYETYEVYARRIMVAVVICTYHREKYIERNLQNLSRGIWNGHSVISDELNVIVVDNGNSLGTFQSQYVRIVPNRNLGGSGGFARGMIEALECGDRYTHVLLMDDDISFETEVLVRTVQFLKVLKELGKPICIGGQMLIENEPTIQYESGGRFINGRLYAFGQGIDLSNSEALIENEKETESHYNAWWYCCIPLKLIQECGLPLPLFIKGDDVEFGLRSGAKFLAMNGIGVWHQSFSQKQSSYLEYYIKRNELIVSAIYGIGAGITSSMIKLFRALGGSVIRRDTGRIAYMKRAYKDFLKGPAFLLQTDAEMLNRELISASKAKPPSALLSLAMSIEIFLEIFLNFFLFYKASRKEFINMHPELINEVAWRKRLGLTSDGVKQ